MSPAWTLAPPIALAAGLAGVLLLGLKRWAEPARLVAACRWTAVLGLAAAAASVAAGLPAGGAASGLLRPDGLSGAWWLLFAAGALPPALLMRARDERPLALLMGSALGMSLLAGANHLFLLLLGLELLSLPVYLLIAEFGAGRRSLEAAVKYFFAGALAAALFLFGLALYYSETGAMLLDGGLPALTPAAALALLLMGCAALFKVGAFPMQFWLPDAYDAAEPELAGFMSTSVKAAGFLLLLRLMSLAPGREAAALWDLWLPILAVATMTFGNLLALRQERLQRLLAYSSIAHAGYLLAAAWAWLRLGPAGPGAAATLLSYLSAYLFMSTGAFLFLRASGVRTLGELRGLAGRAPGLAAFGGLMLLSLAGIPPTAGFLAKLFVLLELLRAGGTWLAIALALNSLVALGYYFQLIRSMTLEPPACASSASPAAGRLERFLLWTCAAAVLALGLWPGSREALAAWLGG